MYTCLCAAGSALALHQQTNESTGSNHSISAYCYDRAPPSGGALNLILNFYAAVSLNFVKDSLRYIMNVFKNVLFNSSTAVELAGVLKRFS